MWNTDQKIVYQLQFFAKEGPGGEKTEPATSKKLKEARNDGQVAKSKEIASAFTLLALFLCLKIYVGKIGITFIENFSNIYNKIPEVVDYSGSNFSIYTVTTLMNNILIRILTSVLPIFITGFIIVFVTDLVQVKWHPTTKPLMPKFSKLNPMSGFKKIFSVRSIFELVKSILKILLIVYIAYSTLKKSQYIIYSLYGLTLKTAIYYIGNIAINLGLKLSWFYMLVGFADFLYERHKFKEDMKMTKQEVKEEWKNSEGNPEVKRKIRSKMQEVSRRRMMNDVATADVVITNPTHFAVGLKYDSNASKAPMVIAKGEDFLAQKIKDAAKEHQIEIVENKPLARMLYYNVDLGAEIPPELYQAVAEVLAYVYSLKNN